MNAGDTAFILLCAAFVFIMTNVIKERPLSSGASDRKATQPAQPAVNSRQKKRRIQNQTRKLPILMLMNLMI